MIYCEIKTPVTGTGATGDAYRPKLGDDYVLDWNQVRTLEDGQWVISTKIEQELLDQILANPTYEVLVQEPIIED